MPASVSTYSESILMLDADTRLYPEKDGGRVFHAPPISPPFPNAPAMRWKHFPPTNLNKSPYRLLSACPVCLKTKSVSESGESK